MIDKNYIEEIRVLEKKEAKEKLAEYAASLGVDVKKTKTFDNMLADLEAGLKAFADMPMPDDNEGLSITDLIDADDELSGAKFDGDESAKEEAKLLFDAPTEAKVEVVEIEEPVVVVEEDIPFVEERFEAAVAKVIESEKPVFALPKNFSPNLMLIGKNPGFCTVPWWIYQWIAETPDWKERPTAFPHPTAHQTLFSLIYYINRNGSVLVRETRNSSFVTLK
ncbi:minor head protein inhibitor of protease [Escherichia phage vB_EcoM_RZ]|uniref:Inhibitor of prohead protease n=1 Tax=Escherichia phage vB_EcoM_RZ TaxID=2893954 RepID=A0AAE8YIK3_9CAUD|nr:minor head protein inhibitor of protease [Escherichia phage vB_EcoM_RZ]UGL60035.1 inhibitor of prohead protease [Escherichia phage vB_EcoM_RZ]